jgi:hypothetical protein
MIRKPAKRCVQSPGPAKPLCGSTAEIRAIRQQDAAFTRPPAVAGAGILVYLTRRLATRRHDAPTACRAAVEREPSGRIGAIAESPHRRGENLARRAGRLEDLARLVLQIPPRILSSAPLPSVRYPHEGLIPENAALGPPLAYSVGSGEGDAASGRAGTASFGGERRRFPADMSVAAGYRGA